MPFNPHFSPLKSHLSIHKRLALAPFEPHRTAARSFLSPFLSISPQQSHTRTQRFPETRSPMRFAGLIGHCDLSFLSLRGNTIVLAHSASALMSAPARNYCRASFCGHTCGVHIRARRGDIVLGLWAPRVYTHVRATLVYCACSFRRGNSKEG